jgi:NADH:ubiquinone oxidoreductase subunit F (NADH-binding)
VNARLEALIGAAKGAWASEQASGKIRINVCLDTSSQARGAEETLAKLRAAVAAKKLVAEIGITGSWGFCWMEPTVTVRSAAGTQTVLYANVTVDRLDEFIEKIGSGSDMPELALGIVEGNATAEIPLLSDHPYMQGQVRRLMANLGQTDPENIEHYLAHGGYEGFGKALEMEPEAIVKEMLDSGLGGRAGAGFPTGRKWDFLRNASTSPRYLVCNADEGDPGAWVNRILLEGDPHLVIEGMLIAALAANADAGYIYIRYEYPLGVERMQKAVAQGYEKGLLGADICGSGKSFELFVIKGAGSYVCGDETGLINSVDGFRGMPRIKPPFPAQAGLWNMPTNVNNVESYANAPMILRNGAAWWTSVSDVKEKGTKMFTFSGHIKQAGCVEIPFGPSVREAFNRYAGGLSGDLPLKGFQPGGPLSGVIPASDLDLTLTLDPYRERGIFLGGGGVVFFDTSTCILDLCMFFVAFCEDESCGRCTTCHGGTQRAVEVFRRIRAGGGRDSDLEKLQQIIKTVVWSNCLHGQSSMAAVKTALRFFADEFTEHIIEKRCRAGVCDGLIEYRVRSQSDPSLPEAVEICPTAAIVESAAGYAVDDSLCIRCGACKEVAPGAMEVRDRYPARIAALVAAGGQ